jgi:methylated-DNA-protein-cysteine methyltransferase-like protein
MEDISFYDQVYQVVRLIPEGRVSSYGTIASYLGTKGSARMVGYAMNAAGTAHPTVPAHRVVNRNGLLTGKFHFNAEDLMKELLENEGIKVENDQVKDFKKLFWDPAIELQL